VQRSRVGAAIGLGLASLLASLAVSELLYRAVVLIRYRQQVASFSAEPWRLVPGSPLIFRLAEGHAGRIPLGASPRTVPYQTNTDGFRDPERGARRPGVPRVLVLGDSFTFGWGVLDEQPYPQRTEKLLRAQGLEVEVINAGIPGYNTEQEAVLLDELMPRYQPDQVVLGYVVNDAEPQANAPQPPTITYRYVRSWSWEDARELVARHLAGQLDWQSPNKLVTSVRYLDGFQPASPKWRESKAALGRIAHTCRAAGAQLLVMMLPDTTEPFDTSYPYRIIHREVMAWSRELGVPAVDLLETFGGRNHVEYMVPDDGHPNARAHDSIAVELANRIGGSLRAPALR
jgi:lysophospholipase L1-like esterase